MDDRVRDTSECRRRWPPFFQPYVLSLRSFPLEMRFSQRQVREKYTVRSVRRCWSASHSGRPIHLEFRGYQLRPKAGPIWAIDVQINITIPPRMEVRRIFIGRLFRSTRNAGQHVDKAFLLRLNIAR